MPATPAYYTTEMVRALPDDGNRYETIHGGLHVTPAPRMWHEIVVGRLRFALDSYLRRFPLGWVFTRGDLSWGPDILVEPDVFVVPVEEVRTLTWSRVKRPLLVAEVLSPSTAHRDRFTKRRLYQEVGVPLCWLVEPDLGFVEVWTPGDVLPVVERERLRWHPAGVPEPLDLELADLFRGVD